MQPHHVLTALGALALAASVWSTAQAAPAAQAVPDPKTRPNIVYILADDLGYGDVGCNNPQSKIDTPNIDSLARDGMRFTDAHSSSALCTPSRYSLMTGRYAWRTRLKSGVLGGYAKPLIEPGRQTVAMLLKAQGYTTACIGKWHLGLGWQRKDGAEPGELNGQTIDFTKPLAGGPQTAGFDYAYVLPASLDMAPYFYVENDHVTDLPPKTIPDSPEPAFYRGGLAGAHFEHQTTLLTFTQKATSYIDERAKTPQTPFLLYLALTAPHTPHLPRPEFKGRSHAGNYGDFVEETDWTVGQVLTALKRNNLDKNTVVLFASDNGSFSKPLHLDTQYGHLSNGTWRGQKSDAWDGGHRVPFVVRWPGVTKAGSTSNQTVGLADFMATCATIVGVHLTPDEAEDSASLLPLLSGTNDAPIHEAVVHHSGDGKFAIRNGQWKLILAKGSGGWSLPENAVPADAPEGQLYDLNADPGEQTNLYTVRPEVVKHLTDLLHKYQDKGRSTPAVR